MEVSTEFKILWGNILSIPGTVLLLTRYGTLGFIYAKVQKWNCSMFPFDQHLPRISKSETRTVTNKINKRSFWRNHFHTDQKWQYEKNHRFNADLFRRRQIRIRSIMFFCGQSENKNENLRCYGYSHNIQGAP